MATSTVQAVPKLYDVIMWLGARGEIPALPKVHPRR